jgi:hypothetical protein
MLRTPSGVALIFGLGIALVACSSPSGSPGESAGAQLSAGTEQSEPAAESQAAAASKDGGGGSGGEAPALTNGPWTGGHGQTTISGALSYTTDAPISTPTSLTQDGETILAYNTDQAFVSIFIRSIGTHPFIASVTTNDWDAESRTCQYSYTRADDAEIDGSFSCPIDRLTWMSADPQPTGTITLEGSFTATR